jgi:hypothetical protein
MSNISPEAAAIIEEKEALVEALTTERDQLRGALTFIGNTTIEPDVRGVVTFVMASYVAGDGSWVMQRSDGTVVPARSFV